MRRLGAAGLSLLFIVGFLLAPATAQPSIPIEVSATLVDESTRAKYVQALEAILRYYLREFGTIPVPSVNLYLYGSTESFEKGLVEVAKVTPGTAGVIARANSATAMWRPWGILVNTSQPRLLEGQMAHEFIHLMQAAWGDRRSDTRGPQWLREGMASFYQAKTEEALGLRPAGTWERGTPGAVGERASILLTVPLTMDSDTWVRLNATLGSASNGWSVLYSWGFVAYSRLAAKVSRDDVVRFFSIPNTGANFKAAFEQAFRMTPSDFEADLRTHIQSLRR